MVFRCYGPSGFHWKHKYKWKLTSSQLISLIYGGNFNLFLPKGLTREDEEYVVGVVIEQFKYLGPFPAKMEEIADPETVQSIITIMEMYQKRRRRHFGEPPRGK